MDIIKNPFVFVIFGGTGDLTYSKLLPALFLLDEKKLINDNYKIISIGRRSKTTKEYRNEIVEKLNKSNMESVEAFLEKLEYYQMDFTNPFEYVEFKEDILYKSKELNTSNIIYYFATAPNFFEVISSNLMEIGLNSLEQGFQRVVIEKPFGYDLKSARSYNKNILKAFNEESIYRIDHYLGKEMIQNIFTIRFTNKIFDLVWDKDAIDNIQIVVTEKEGINNRGGYYEKSGALRDMIQNHLLQVLALIGMDAPKEFNSRSIKDEKVKVLKNLKIDSEANHENIVFGQYKTYQHEERVAENSLTETFVAMTCEINNERWRGVPFYLKTGKKLENKKAEITIEFRKSDYSFNDPNIDILPNLLVIKVQPEESIYFRYNSKEPGVTDKIVPVNMEYCQSCVSDYVSTEAYERLIYDVIKGDNTLFTRWDELESSWEFIDEILKYKEEKEIYKYDDNSYGPDIADEMLRKSDRMWWKDVLE